MGSGASKSAAQSTLRKFPNRAPGSAPPPPTSSTAADAAEQAASRIRAAHKAYGDRAAAAAQKDFNLEDPAQGRREAPKASFSKNEAIQQDGHDPQRGGDPRDNMIPPALAQRLREIGAVQPNPTYSHSSTASSQPSQQGASTGPIFPAPSQNVTLSALEARQRVQEEADDEFEKLGTSMSQGRRFLHAGMIRDVLVMRERGASEAQIEARFDLRKGVLRGLGPRELYKSTVKAGEGEPLPV